MAEDKVGPVLLQCDKLHREGGSGSKTGSPYKKDIEATTRLVTCLVCLQPTSSKKRWQTTAVKTTSNNIKT